MSELDIWPFGDLARLEAENGRLLALSIKVRKSLDRLLQEVLRHVHDELRDDADDNSTLAVRYVRTIEAERDRAVAQRDRAVALLRRYGTRCPLGGHENSGPQTRTRYIWCRDDQCTNPDCTRTEECNHVAHDVADLLAEMENTDG